ncbi:MAG: ATP-dependent DNA helicase [Myxococcales bacterium]|nr:ATP-dependent DNA helicase [Myxococcales bacterium]
MAGAVAGALKANRPLLVEAGTGTGKTLAYLVPAILSGMKVVISTGTKNLQEQILKKEIPLLRDHLPVDFVAAGLKGIANYLCLRRFHEYDAQLVARGDDTLDLHTFREWAAQTVSGDRAELAGLPDDSPLWREVSSTTETRIGPRCRYFEDCFVTRARREAQRADLLVVNHHLFFADLTLKSQWPQAQLLPPYEAVIFDEAHQIEDVATDYFGLSVSSLRTLGLVRDLRKAIAAKFLDVRTGKTADRLETVVDLLWTVLRPRLPRDGRAAVTEATWQGEPTRAWHDLDTVLEEVENASASARADTTEGNEANSALSRRSRSLRDDLAVIADRADRRHVYWAETRGRTVLLHASPVDVADPLREKLLGHVEAAIFTSATLAAGGSFDYVRSRLGLETALEARLDSPFDYASQALLYLPRDLPEPSDRAFPEAAARRIAELLAASGGRAFLLFTSHRQMSAVHQLIAPSLEWPVLLQGEKPKHLLLEEFRARPSVLFATASFWEGVDVVGEALRLVVIDKLPFAPPDDPLVQARCQRLEEQGKDAFATYSVPRAALTLAQGFGRLIRHRTDRGVVALLDRRATTRGYGRKVLSSLPADCPRTAALEDVQAFFRTHGARPDRP